jgi:hypothetical protein
MGGADQLLKVFTVKELRRLGGTDLSFHCTILFAVKRNEMNQSNGNGMAASWVGFEGGR